MTYRIDDDIIYQADPKVDYNLNECYRYLSSLVQSAVNLLHHPHLSLLVLSLENSAGIKLQLFSRLIDACHYLG